ncbi:MAG: HEAT repeat domain-containing protein [Planctomycetes bacterium]|nr:HEAT repeat domain-containing protein [Planctomycetota bacterium]
MRNSILKRDVTSLFAGTTWRAMFIASALVSVVAAQGDGNSGQGSLPKAPDGQKAGAGKVLGLPTPARDKTDRSSALVIGRRRDQGEGPAAAATLPKDGELALVGFIEALNSTKELADAELVAEYSLLTVDERRRLIARAHRLSDRAISRLARVWRSLVEREAAPALVTVLHSRTLGKDTTQIVDHAFFLLGADAKLVALDALRSNNKVLRSVVGDRLPAMLSADDLPQLRVLLDHEDQGVRLAALSVLAKYCGEHPEVDLAPLTACLRHRDGAVRAQAAVALGGAGGRAIAALMPIVEAQTDGPEWFLATLLLAKRELTSDVPVLPAIAVQRLGRSRYDGRLFARTVASVVAGLRLFDDPASLRDKASGFSDLTPQEIVSGLVNVTDVSTYYPELGVCHDAALLALRLLTGMDFAADHKRWSRWWNDVRADFVPLTADAGLSAETAAQSRMLILEGERLETVLIGAQAAEPASVRNAFVARLEETQLLELVSKLRERGLFDVSQRIREGQGAVEARSIVLETPHGRARDAFPRNDSLRLATFKRVIDETVARESWQQFCPPDLNGTARRDWWIEQERRFAEAKTDAQRRGHEIELALRVLPDPTLEPQVRANAIERLVATCERGDATLPDRASEVLLPLVTSKDINADDRQRILRVLAHTKAETPTILSAMAGLTNVEIRARLVDLFAIRGEDALVAALRHDASTVRACAASEAGRAGNDRLSALLIAGLRDEDWDVRRRCAESLGDLRDETAKAEILRLINDDEALVRHAALLASAKIGGPGVFEVLLSATAPGKPGDRLAAVRGLAMLDEPRAASALVAIAAAHLQEPLGLQAIRGLEDRSNLGLRNEVRRWLESSDDPLLRQSFTFLLGEMGDAVVAPSLLGMVERGESSMRACMILAQLSGLDHCSRRERVALYRAWIESFAKEPVSVRLVNALAEARIESRFERALANPDDRLGLIDELGRLITDTSEDQWAIRALAAQALREFTGRDYGPVRRDTSLLDRRAIVERYRAHVDAKESNEASDGRR